MNDFSRITFAVIVSLTINNFTQASITIQSTDILARAVVFTTQNNQHFYGTDVPTLTPSPQLNANMSGVPGLGGWLAFSQNTIGFSENSGQTTLLVTIDHHERNGRSVAGTFAGAGNTTTPRNDSPNTQGTALTFTANANIPYELSGFYEMTGPAGISVRHIARLYDVTADQVLFYNEQMSVNTLNEVFTLGETGGDNLNFLSGNLSGQLMDGHI